MSDLLQILDHGVLPWEAISNIHEEKTQALISPLVNQILTTLFSQRINPLKKAHLKATLYWLQAKQSTHTSLDEIVQGYLDAFYHLSQVEDWPGAYQIFSLRLPLLPDYTFYENLGIWGYYQEQIKIGEILLQKISTEVDCLCLLEIGNAYFELEQRQKALAFYQQLLDIGTKTNNLSAICRAYGGHAKIHDKEYKADLAVEYFQKQLQLSQTLKLVSEEVIALVGLTFGRAKFTYFKAQKSFFLLLLKKIDQIDCKKTLAFIFIEIGGAFMLSNNYTKATDYLEKSLQYSLYIYNKKMVFGSLSSWGTCQAMSISTEEGVKILNQSLYFAQKKGDLFLELMTLNNLAIIYYNILKDSEKSVFYLKKALKISEYLEYLVEKSYILSQLAFHYTCTNNDYLSTQCADQALAIAKQENNKGALALVFAIKANAYWLKRNYLKAIILLARSLIILPPWKSSNGNLIWQRFLELLEQKFSFLKPVLKLVSLR